MKRLDKYLLAHFFLSFFAVTIAIGLTIIVINMVEELRDFIDNDVSLLQILEYYVYFGGWVIRSFVPMRRFLKRSKSAKRSSLWV